MATYSENGTELKGGESLIKLLPVNIPQKHNEIFRAFYHAVIEVR
jgi:hypothetical protein